MTDATEDLNESFSLADLADLDVSDIEEVRFVSLPAGIYDFEVTNADFHEDTKDGETRFKIEFALKIIEVKSIMESGKNPEEFVGKEHTERFFVKPTDEQEKVLKAIGRVRAFITDMGGDSGVVSEGEAHHLLGRARIDCRCLAIDDRALAIGTRLPIILADRYCG